MRGLSAHLKIEIFLPVLLALLVVYAVLTPGAQADLMRGDRFFQSGEFFAFVIFGNFAHNFFFVWQMFRFPEFRDWARSYRFYGLSIYVVLPLMFFALWAVFGFGLEITRVIPRKNLGDDVFNWVLFLIVLVNAHHSISQSRGLSFSYAHNLSSEVNQRERDHVHGIERWMTRLLFANEALFFFFFLGLLDRGISPEERSVRVYFVSFVLLIGVGLMLGASRKLGLLKSVVAVRFLPRAFYGFSPLPTFFTYALHGLESTLLTWRMVDRSRASSPRWLKVEFLILFVGLGLFYIFIYRPLGGVWKDSAWATPVRSGFVAFAVTHYLSEGFFYRFRNEHTRKFIAPLMKL
jgi:hypothetical protein